MLEKVFTMLWAIGTHKKNIVFRNHTCNRSSVLERAKKIFHKTILFTKCNNISNCPDLERSNILNAGKIYKINIGIRLQMVRLNTI